MVPPSAQATARGAGRAWNPDGYPYGSAAESEPIGERSFDDHFELVGARSLVLDGGGRRLTVLCGRGYRLAQVFAPPGKPFLALEPMTARTNALVDGECRVVRPGDVFTAHFQIRPERVEPARGSR